MSRRNLIVAASLSAVALIGFGLLFTSIVGGGFSATQKLQLAMELLDEGRWDVADRIARDLRATGMETDENSAWQYVQGVSKLKSVADNLDTPKNRRVLLDASNHLLKADQLGFPTGYTGKGQYYLGWCQFHTYHWDAAAEKLSQVHRLWPQMRSAAFRMKVQSHLRKAPPDVTAAQAAIAAWQAIPGMSPAEQDRIKLAQANLAFVTQQPENCEALLADISGSSPEAYQSLLWRTRLRLARSTAGKGASDPHRAQLLEEAADITKTLKIAADTPADLRRQAAFLSGKVLRQQGKLEAALSTFSGTRQSHPQSAEAIAAGIEEVEILVQTGEVNEALSTLRYILRNIEDLALYNELWMPVTEFRSRLLDIGRKLRLAEKFDKAIELAELMALAFPRSDSVRLRAEALEQWADVIAARLNEGDNTAQVSHREQSQAKHHEAAELYTQLAQLELRSTDYPNILWLAITNFQQAGELERANELLVDYLRHEDRTKRPRGYLALGRNYVDAARWQRAIDPLERCRIEHPTHPISFEARLLAAKAHLELNELDQAIELLNENLSGDATALRPTSDLWRDSLYQLALTVFRQGDEALLELRLNPAMAFHAKEILLQTSQAKFIEVTDHLGGFVTRYPDDPRHFEAMYLIAKSHRLAAETPWQNSQANTAIVETVRRKLMQQRRQLLEQALAEFQRLRQTIAHSQESLTLTEQTNALIRNCLFGEADTLYDLGRWDEAITAYQNVASRFLNKPESLEALLQMAQCHRKLGQESVAQRILVQAEQVLARIPPEFDAHFVSLTRTSRDGWSDLLGSLRTWD